MSGWLWNDSHSLHRQISANIGIVKEIMDIQEQIYRMICRGLHIDGKNILPSDVIGTASNEEVRSVLAAIIERITPKN